MRLLISNQLCCRNSINHSSNQLCYRNSSNQLCCRNSIIHSRNNLCYRNSSNQLEKVTDDALNLTSTTNFQSTHTTQTSDIDTSTTTTISSNYSTPSVSPGEDGTEIQVVGLDKVTTQQPGSKKKSALWKEALIQALHSVQI